jgi:hypothetical protein
VLHQTLCFAKIAKLNYASNIVDHLLQEIHHHQEMELNAVIVKRTSDDLEKP